MINNDDNNSAQHMTDEKWKNYYKFTFIRNPYEKIVSAYEMCKRCYSNMPDDDKQNYVSFKQFIENREKTGNISYFNSFIKLTDHLLDYDGKLNMNFIGDVGHLDRDLIIVLNQLGIKQIIHLEVKNDFIPFLHIKNYDEFMNYYDNDILSQVNELFMDDFECFNYKKFTCISKMKQYYENFKNNDNSQSQIEEYYKNCKLINIKETMSLEFIININATLYELLTNLKIIYNIDNNNIFVNNCVDKINNLIKMQINTFKDKNLQDFLEMSAKMNYSKIKSFNREKCKKICKICNNFECYNKKSYEAHTFFCEIKQ